MTVTFQWETASGSSCCRCLSVVSQTHNFQEYTQPSWGRMHNGFVKSPSSSGKSRTRRIIHFQILPKVSFVRLDNFIRNMHSHIKQLTYRAVSIKIVKKVFLSARALSPSSTPNHYPPLSPLWNQLQPPHLLQPLQQHQRILERHIETIMLMSRLSNTFMVVMAFLRQHLAFLRGANEFHVVMAQGQLFQLGERVNLRGILSLSPVGGAALLPLKSAGNSKDTLTLPLSTKTQSFIFYWLLLLLTRLTQLLT